MVQVIGTTQKFVNPQEDAFGVDSIFSDIYGNPNFVEPFGNGGAAMTRQGNTLRFVSAGANPSTINGLYVISSITFPANTFDVAARGVAISAMGSVANNTTTKTISV
jgi:hypothetical protein